MELYTKKGPINCDIDFDTSHVRGKTAIVTGGASGIGKAYVQALANAGAYVAIGDLSSDSGNKLASELPNTKFVKCDVTQWEHQLELFRVARSHSPDKTISFVVANAGIAGLDDLATIEEGQEEPTKPTLKEVQVDLIGAMYSTKLAQHYFAKQASGASSPHDTCLILQGSMAAYFDCTGMQQYMASKFALRGLMRALRLTSWKHGTRVNYICPWYIKTAIFTDGMIKQLDEFGVDWAGLDAAAEALMRLLNDRSVNGRTLSITPQGWAPRGYIDIDQDDYPADTWIGKYAEKQLKASLIDLVGSLA